MTIEEIKNNYAKEQGRDSWKKLVESYTICGEMLTSTFLKHENAVIKLIQDELKNDFIDKLNNFHNKEIAGSDLDMESYRIVSYKLIKLKHSILNTENIK